jgi:hypothetical protein
MKEIQIKKIDHENNGFKGVSTDINKGDNHAKNHFHRDAS